jgi:hypothetical protein
MMMTAEQACRLTEIGKKVKNYFNFLQTSVTKGETQKYPTNLKFTKPTDMTIRWKAFFDSTVCGGKCIF